jgi:hypothetical protein
VSEKKTMTTGHSENQIVMSLDKVFCDVNESPGQFGDVMDDSFLVMLSGSRKFGECQSI